MDKLLTKFLNKWRQEKETGFIKPVCHIDDIRELAEKVEKNTKEQIIRQLNITILFNEKNILEGKIVDWGYVLRNFIKFIEIEL